MMSKKNSKVDHRSKSKKHQARMLENIRGDKLQFTIQGLHNFLSSRAVPTRDTANQLYNLGDRIKMLKQSDEDPYSSFKREFMSNVYGSQLVRMKLRSVQFPVITSVGGILTTTVPMAFTGLGNNTDLTNVFDEVRFLKPAQFVYYPQLAPNGATTNNLGIGVIDYDDSSALNSIQQSLSYDTAKVINLAPVTAIADAYKTGVKWDLSLDGQPDQVWNTTTSYTTVVAWLKFYNLTSSLTSSTTYGFVIYCNEVEFRQSN